MSKLQSAKTANRFSFVVEDFEDRVQFGDLQQILNPLGKIQKLEFAALIRHGSETGYQFANTGAVDVRDIAQGQQDFLFTVGHQFTDCVAERTGSFTKCDASFRIHYGYITDFPVCQFNTHGVSPYCRDNIKNLILCLFSGTSRV